MQMQWFRRDAARNAAQKSPSRMFTLGGVALITAILAGITLLIAFPLRRSRERAMTAAAREQLTQILAAVDEYRAQHYRLPDRLDQLETVGYSTPPMIVVCRFRHFPDPRDFDDHLELALHHRASNSAIVGRYPPTRSGAEGEEVGKETACPDASNDEGSQ